MALEKTVEQPNGTAANYHKVLRGTVDFVTGNTVLEIASYLSAEARQAGKQPISSMTTTIYMMPSFTGDPRPWAYEELKKQSEWEGSKDV